MKNIDRGQFAIEQEQAAGQPARGRSRIMIDNLFSIIIDESKWLTASMILALVVVLIVLRRWRYADSPTRRRVAVAMNLFFGTTIGTMAFGHLLAVTVKLALGTLEGSRPMLYLIGVALAVPSWLLTHRTRRSLTSGKTLRWETLLLNAWLAITLLALGLHNLPLAIPGILNMGYELHSRRVVGWTIAGMAVVVNAGLFIGSLIFLASGQSFEQFKGIE